MTLYTHPDMPGLYGDVRFALPDGRQFPRVFWRTATPEEIADLGFVLHVPPEPEPPALADLKADRLAALADRRWQAETVGIVLNGVPIKTDRESTAKITAAYVQAWNNPAFSVRWKVDAGMFVTLDAATIIAIGDAVTAHVQACFDVEDVLTSAILAAEDASALSAIDIDTGWPA